MPKFNFNVVCAQDWSQPVLGSHLSLPVLLFSHVVLYFFTFFSIKSLF